MRVCRAYQIPHSTFLGWSKSDRDKAIWEYVQSLRRCPSCGTRDEEWTESEGGDRDAYRPETYRCRGCELMESHRAQLDQSKLGKGLHVRLVRNDRR